MDQANSKNTDPQNTACSVILNVWVPPAILKTKVMCIYLFLRHVLVESRTCFWSSSIRFCCKCDSAVVCVSCKKPQKKCNIRNPFTELAGSLSNVWSWLKNFSETIVELHSAHKTHITAVQPPKLALQIMHMHTHTHSHTQRRRGGKGIYLWGVLISP